MYKEKLYINDNTFSHAPSSSWYNQPNYFEWVRNRDDETDKIFITDLHLVDNYRNKKVYGWIIEPPELIPGYYSFAKENHQKFEKIFTYDKELLNISDVFDFLPIGGCWIEEGDRKIHQKNKLICTISSNKRMTKSHNFRHEVISKIPKIDVFGNGYNPIHKKIEVLKDYMFCVVIENQKMDYLFTEKIIDCFVTGTIPIYYGCPSINKFFNSEGLIVFETIDELNEIIKNLDKNFYETKLEFIKENFELAKKYVVADDIIYEKIKKLYEY